MQRGTNYQYGENDNFRICYLSLCAHSRLKFTPAKTNLDFESLLKIEADRAHRIDLDTQRNLIYEVPAAEGFVLDASEYMAEYAQGPLNTVSAEISKVIRLDPVAPTHAGPVSVDLVPGQDFYRVSPYNGLW